MKFKWSMSLVISFKISCYVYYTTTDSDIFLMTWRFFLICKIINWENILDIWIEQHIHIDFFYLIGFQLHNFRHKLSRLTLEVLLR